MSSKETNPKDTVGVKKAPLHHIPCRVLFELGLAMLEGHCKYGSHNYRNAGVRASVYYDAVQRHIMAWWEGEDIDPDSGLSHLAKAIASLVVLRDGMHMCNWVDDRPIRLPQGLNTTTLNAGAAKIIERFPEPKAPFTHKPPIESGTSDGVVSNDATKLFAKKASWQSVIDPLYPLLKAANALVEESRQPITNPAQLLSAEAESLRKTCGNCEGCEWPGFPAECKAWRPMRTA